LAQGGDVNAQYSKLTFTPTQADWFVLAFRSWLRTYGNSQPDWFPEANLSQPLPSTVLSKYEVGLPFSCALCVFPLAFLFGFLHMDESLMQHFSSVTVYYLVVCGSWLCSLYPFVIHSLWLLANLVSCDADVESVGATHIASCRTALEGFQILQKFFWGSTIILAACSGVPPGLAPVLSWLLDQSAVLQ
jgi:hypothetical protein